MLYKTGRLKENQRTIFNFLKAKIGLQQSQTPLDAVIAAALEIEWTRDPFDRFIVADCIANGSKLVTKDSLIHTYYKDAIWD